MVLGVWYWEAVLPSVQNCWLCSGSRILQGEQIYVMERDPSRKVMEKAARMRTRKMTRKMENMRSKEETVNSKRPIPMFRTRMAARVATSTKMVIPKIMAVDRTIGRSIGNPERNRASFIRLVYWNGPWKRHLYIVLSSFRISVRYLDALSEKADTRGEKMYVV